MFIKYFIGTFVSTMADKIFYPTNFKNQLDDIKFTSTDILNIICDYDLPIWDIRLVEIEDDYNLPIFIKSFYSYIDIYNRIPTSNEFFTYYINVHNRAYFDANHYDEYLKIGLQSRCYRTYPSLVRELYFAKVLSENLDSSYDVIYNINLDLYEGIDVMITTKDDKYFGINLFVGTYYSKIARTNKETRHSAYSNVTYIDVPIYLKSKHNLKCGEFVLYSDEHHYSELIKQLN